MSTSWGTGIGWFFFGSLTLTLGASVAGLVVLPRHEAAGEGARSEVRQWVDSLALCSALAVVVGVGGLFWRQLADFRDPFSPLMSDTSLLLSTSWGGIWKISVLASFATVGGLALIRRRIRRGWWLAFPALSFLAALPALTGHASSGEFGGILMIGLDTLHVWAAGAWIGGLATVLVVEARFRRKARGESLLPDLVPRFSRVAAVSVATLIVTGTIAAFNILPDIGALFRPGYGRILLLKLIAVVVVLVLGGVNARVLTPRLIQAEGQTAMRRTAGSELFMGQVVLAMTAWLVRTSPDLGG